MEEFRIDCSNQSEEELKLANELTRNLFRLRPRSPIFVNAGAVKRRADVFAQ